MNIASSESPYGPWDVTPISVINMKEYHQSNPSLLQLNDTSFMLSYRFNSPTGERVGVAISNNNGYKGPFINIANLSLPFYGEDPFLWRDLNDATFHMLFHGNFIYVYAFA